MRLVNEFFENILESDVDLSKGRLEKTFAIKEDASPIDNITKYAWYDNDYEEVQMYVLNREFPFDIPKEEQTKTDELTEVIDALLGYGGE